MSSKDERIIKGLVGYGDIDFDDISWMNCNLYKAGMKDFESRKEYDEAIKKDDDLLFKFLIIYSFERIGFDSRINCNNCDKQQKCKLHKRYEEKNKNKKVLPRSHPIAVLKALNEIMRKEYKAESIKELLELEKIEELAKNWLNKAKYIHKNDFNNDFSPRFKSKHLQCFLIFYKNGRIKELRKMVRENKFKDAYELLTGENNKSAGLIGVGPKVAKFVIRDLAFSITDWGKEKKLEQSLNPKILSYALPVDRWVRRISVSIPEIFEKFRSKLKPWDFINDNINNAVNERLSEIIAEVCCRMKLNPLRFDFGAYIFGTKEIEKQGISVDDIYKKLYKKFVKGDI